jgi:hypothetical protein
MHRNRRWAGAATSTPGQSKSTCIQTIDWRCIDVDVGQCTGNPSSITIGMGFEDFPARDLAQPGERHSSATTDIEGVFPARRDDGPDIRFTPAYRITCRRHARSSALAGR